MKAIYRTATPYPKDAMNLPVGDVETAISFYEMIMGFQVLSRKDSPSKSVVLGRDGIQIGLAENGGDAPRLLMFYGKLLPRPIILDDWQENMLKCTLAYCKESAWRPFPL